MDKRILEGLLQRPQVAGKGNYYLSCVLGSHPLQTLLTNSREMNGRWLGAMPVDAFFDKYVPATQEPLSGLRAKPFERVRGKVLATTPL